MTRTPGSSSRRPPRARRNWACRSRTGACANWPPTSPQNTIREVRIGRERLRQILHASHISFQRTRTWKESADPDKEAKLGRIEHVTSRFPGRCFAFDQFGPLSIRPAHGSTWARQKKPRRLPAKYHRTHGIRYFHGCYSLGDDQLWGITRLRKGGDHTLAALKSSGGPPRRRPHLRDHGQPLGEQDPANPHLGGKTQGRAVLHPTSASWANPIEAQSGPLRTFTMGGSDHPNHTVLARRLQEYLAWRNANARHPDVLAAQRRERARIRSERQQRWGRPRPQAA